VSEVNVKQMPANPFRDSARNINGDRTGKGERSRQRELGEAKDRSWVNVHLHPTHSFPVEA
jgi:hypothetical protein